jgi:hypothetical protein
MCVLQLCVVPAGGYCSCGYVQLFQPQLLLQERVVGYIVVPSLPCAAVSVLHDILASVNVTRREPRPF